MTREERRGHLSTLLDDLANQRHVDEDELRTELIHFIFELDDEIRQLRDRVSDLAAQGADRDR